MFFFFSSRRRHTRLQGDWSSDVCSSDLGGERVQRMDPAHAAADWQACREQQLPWFTARAPGHALWRLSVPQTAPALALPDGCTGPLIEWHGALRWVQAPRALGHRSEEHT